MQIIMMTPMNMQISLMTSFGDLKYFCLSDSLLYLTYFWDDVSSNFGILDLNVVSYCVCACVRAEACVFPAAQCWDGLCDVSLRDAGRHQAAATAGSGGERSRRAGVALPGRPAALQGTHSSTSSPCVWDSSVVKLWTRWRTKERKLSILH